ncbi:type II toxin-antitoxin system RelE/ParE family toxin [Pararhizobium sp.]|uniref:type II toxin-antitoxin system RelE/ParE family toxin n=1 Tax=Pararhizobium sp. TaxID=1977563 RepID=UPI0027229BE9|nr:type II toxin-antitoxin system RelE/ParE family toxin [Pararhizobium sp.]MDO9417204.1 type II toxin-antitoxin system RelE/ParE family toxin [Pararhizobium sp.]
MVEIVYSRKARMDLLDIWNWIAASGGVKRADAALDRVEKRIIALEQHPEMGPAKPAIDPAARMLVIERWLVLYASYGGQVRIVRIVDGVTDLKRGVWIEDDDPA